MEWDNEIPNFIRYQIIASLKFFFIIIFHKAGIEQFKNCTIDIPTDENGFEDCEDWQCLKYTHYSNNISKLGKILQLILTYFHISVGQLYILRTFYQFWLFTHCTEYSVLTITESHCYSKQTYEIFRKI